MIQKFIETESFFELITEVLERARDRQSSQYYKFEAAIDHQVFFTDQGVEKRKEKIKLKVLSKNQNKENIGADGNAMDPEVEKCMRMLQVHNSKVDKIRQGYNNYVAMRL